MTLMKKEPRPPRVFHYFFRWFCRSAIRDHIEGDLLELYGERVRTKGQRNADIKFIIDVLLLFRSGIIQPYKFKKYKNQNAMIKNYFKIAWRNLTHSKAFRYQYFGSCSWTYLQSFDHVMGAG